ncbi:hypothetical protein ACIQRK_05520 [Streptomyces anulatus]
MRRSHGLLVQLWVPGGRAVCSATFPFLPPSPPEQPAETATASPMSAADRARRNAALPDPCISHPFVLEISLSDARVGG